MFAGIHDCLCLDMHESQDTGKIKEFRRAIGQNNPRQCSGNFPGIEHIGRYRPEGGAPTPKSPVSRRICRDSRADLPRFTGASAQKPGGAARNLSGAAGNLSGAARNLSGAARFLSGAARFLVVEMGPYLGWGAFSGLAEGAGGGWCSLFSPHGPHGR